MRPVGTGKGPASHPGAAVRGICMPSGPSALLTARGGGVLAVLALVGIWAAPATAAAPTTYHVDCNAGSDGASGRTTAERHRPSVVW